MNRTPIVPVVLLFLTAVAALAEDTTIDRATLDLWSAPYRGWYYYADHVIGSDPAIPGYEGFGNTDVPTVYQLPGDDTWYMSFIAFDGNGYNSFVAESDDLIHWENPRLAMGFGPEGDFDYGGRVVGAYLYESYDVDAPRVLKPIDGEYYTLYGAYPRQGGYELRPGGEGVAVSTDGLTWTRAKDEAILSVYDADCQSWESSCIYQPWLVEHEGTYYNFYNAAEGSTEQIGLATSQDLLNWTRYEGNPIVQVTPGGYDSNFASDPKVFRDGDHWTMLYFGVGNGGAHIMAAFSTDLLHWTAHPEPLYAAGGNPSGLDSSYAHKISLVQNPEDGEYYLYYCAVGNQGRGIGLITSKPPATLVGHWTFDSSEAVGAATVGDDLQVVGDAAYTAEGIVGGALSLDGDGDYLRLDEADSLPEDIPIGNSAYTVAAFFKTDTPGRNGIVGWGASSGGCFNGTRTGNAGEDSSQPDSEALVNYNWGGDVDLARAADISDGEWHHVAVTYDPSFMTKTIYLDGEQLGDAKRVPTLSVTAENFRVGAIHHAYGDEFFDGLLDDLRIYAIALDADEVFALYEDLTAEPLEGDLNGDGLVGRRGPGPGSGPTGATARARRLIGSPAIHPATASWGVPIWIWFGRIGERGLLRLSRNRGRLCC